MTDEFTKSTTTFAGFESIDHFQQTTIYYRYRTIQPVGNIDAFRLLIGTDAFRFVAYGNGLDEPPFPGVHHSNRAIILIGHKQATIIAIQSDRIRTRSDLNRRLTFQINGFQNRHIVTFHIGGVQKTATGIKAYAKRMRAYFGGIANKLS